MKFFTVLTTVFVLLYKFEGSQSFFKHLVESHRGEGVKTVDLIGNLGYPAEAHNVETEDGYILTLHRIPYSKESSTKTSTRKCPLLLQHGLLGSSLDFLLISTGDSLPTLLSDLGFDVWLGNARGNRYSRRHKRLQPTEKDFWNYTWHEAAVYDIPAMVDYILETTSAETVAYIGYSMGSTMYLVLASTNPEYSKKIEVGMLMAPIAFASNIKSPLLSFLAPISNTGSIRSHVMASSEFLANNYILQMFTKYFCSLPVLTEIFCKKHMFLVFGTDYTKFSPSTRALLLNHYPAGTSTKSIVHYAQLIKSGKFQQFDYGRKPNMIHYGSAYPPEYDLTKIEVPTYFYAGKNDFLAAPDDVNQTAKYLSTLKKLVLVDKPKFSHLDFLAEIDVRNLVYKPLIKDLLEELNEEEPSD